MVDVTAKPDVSREAEARGRIYGFLSMPRGASAEIGNFFHQDVCNAPFCYGAVFRKVGAL